MVQGKAHAMKMIERTKLEADKCRPLTIELMNKSSEFIEDSFNNKEISQKDFDDLRHIVRTIANGFSKNCKCNR